MAVSPSPSMQHRNALLTVLLAYASFVAPGMVNTLVGVAWPAIRDTFGLPIDALGAFLIANTTGYLLASAWSGRLAALNTGTLLASCCGVTGLVLVGMASVPAWAAFIALGVVAGLSGGALDGNINAYAAAHFSPRAMNWLHACFGIGATLGPALLTAVLTAHGSWRIGYVLIAGVQLTLASAFGLTRQFWNESTLVASSQPVACGTPLNATLRLPLAWLGIGLFFVFNGLGSATGNWMFSLLTEGRGALACHP